MILVDDFYINYKISQNNKYNFKNLVTTSSNSKQSTAIESINVSKSLPLNVQCENYNPISLQNLN